MKAETVYNVFKALDNQEAQRFYAMLDIRPAKLGKPKLLNNVQTTEWLIKTISQ